MALLPLPSKTPRLVAGTALAIATLVAGCAQTPRAPGETGLERPASTFSTGRIDFRIVDEYGIALPRMRVNLAWDKPTFHATSAFTNSEGAVSFSGVPPVAEVSVDHPGGIYVQTLLVPQSGRPELRVILDTMGGGEQMREQERAARAGRVTTPAR